MFEVALEDDGSSPILCRGGGFHGDPIGEEDPLECSPVLAPRPLLAEPPRLGGVVNGGGAGGVHATPPGPLTECQGSSSGVTCTTVGGQLHGTVYVPSLV